MTPAQHLTWDSRPGTDGSTVHLPHYVEAAERAFDTWFARESERPSQPGYKAAFEAGFTAGVAVSPVYSTQERSLMQAGAIQAYERVLAIVSLRGRSREAVEVQLEHLKTNLLAFGPNGDLVIAESTP